MQGSLEYPKYPNITVSVLSSGGLEMLSATGALAAFTAQRSGAIQPCKLLHSQRLLLSQPQGLLASQSWRDEESSLGSLMVADCLENPNPEARRLLFHCRKSESWGELAQDRYSCHGLFNLSSVYLQTQDLSHLALVWRPAAFPKSHLHNSWSLEELETWHVGQQRANFSSSALGPTEFMLWISSRAGNEAACLQAAHVSVLPQSKTMTLSSPYGRTAQEQ